MDRDTWNELIEHIRQAIVDRSFDPDQNSQADCGRRSRSAVLLAGTYLLSCFGMQASS